MDTIYIVLGVLTGVLVGVVTTLKAVAPKTKTHVDDEWLKRAEWALEFTQKMGVHPDRDLTRK